MGARIASRTLVGSTSSCSANIHKEPASSDFSRLGRHPSGRSTRTTPRPSRGRTKPSAVQSPQLRDRRESVGVTIGTVAKHNLAPVAVGVLDRRRPGGPTASALRSPARRSSHTAAPGGEPSAEWFVEADSVTAPPDARCGRRTPGAPLRSWMVGGGAARLGAGRLGG